jgi:simple sugar transport system permease protein
MAAPAVVAPRRDIGRSALALFLRYREISVAIVAIIVCVVFQIASSGSFFSLDEMAVVLRLTGQYGLLALAEVLVMITGEIDLSAAKVYGLAPFVMYFFYNGFTLPLIFFSVQIPACPLVIALLLAILASACIGFVNGFVTVRLGVPSLITTLGTFFFLDGFTNYIANSEQLPQTYPDPFSKIFGYNLYTPGTGFNIAYASDLSIFFWAAGMALVVTYILKKTIFGLHTFSVGSNLEGAKEIGVPVQRTKILNFMLGSSLAGLGGILFAVYNTETDPSAGDPSLNLFAIAAAVIGGTSLFGGSGTAIGAILGAFVIASLSNGLPLIGVSANISNMIIGFAILAAMVLNIYLDRFRARRG